MQEIRALLLRTRLHWRWIIPIRHYPGVPTAAPIVEHDFNNPRRQESFFFCHLTTWPHSPVPMNTKGDSFLEEEAKHQHCSLHPHSFHEPQPQQHHPHPYGIYGSGVQWGQQVWTSAVEKASSGRVANQITRQLMKVMGNEVLLEAAWSVSISTCHCVSIGDVYSPAEAVVNCSL